MAANVTALAQVLGADVKTVWTLLNGKANDLSVLTTTDKTNLVNALNSLKTELDTFAGGAYSDADADARVQAAKGNFTTTSANEWASTADVATKMAADIQAGLDSLVTGAPGTLDTLDEIAAALQDNPDVITNILSALAKRVAVDQVQSFTAAEQLQGCQNLGIGDPTTDFAAAYTAARDA